MLVLAFLILSLFFMFHFALFSSTYNIISNSNLKRLSSLYFHDLKMDKVTFDPHISFEHNEVKIMFTILIPQT